MGLALYRKYRPQTFGDLTDQVHVRVTLQNEIGAGKIAHAYLFAGPRGIGKTTTARIFAKVINCTDRKGNEPCLACEACLSIQDNKAVDILEIDAASHTGVDAVRENIIESVRFTPARLKYKVFIIDEVHMLSTAAFNALLKTLEEPPAHAIFILATTETHKVPATILSRCQRFDFRKIGVPDLVKRLATLASKEEVDVDTEVLKDIARAAGGSLRDAESMLGQILALGEKRVTRDEAALVLPHSDLDLARQFLDVIHRGRGGDALQLIDKLVADGVDFARFLEDTQRLLRLGLLAAMGETSGLSELDEPGAALVSGPLAGWGTPRLLAAIETIMTAQERVKRGDGSPLPLEIVVATLLAPPPAAAPTVSMPAPVAPKPVAPPPVKKAPAEASFGAPENILPLAKGEPLVPPQAGEGVSSPSAITLPLEAFREKWQQLIVAAGEVSHSLSYVLNGSKPEAIEAEKLIIGVPFAFHRDRLNDHKNRRTVEDACEKIFGCKVCIEGLVVEGLQNPASEVVSVSMEDPVIKNVLDAFGGRVVS
ncbi:DNA polymerase III subunit gamma/tau [Patescibacteria group bacterium]|nr:MAG: DNA polymerase III subunit gamma/tau [Patescibacteria group bacterium]